MFLNIFVDYKNIHIFDYFCVTPSRALKLTQLEVTVECNEYNKIAVSKHSIE